MYLRVRQTTFRRDTCKGIFLICDNDLFRVDDNAIEILQLCNGLWTEEEIIDQMSSRYPTDNTMTNDIKEFLLTMESHGIIIRQLEPTPMIPIYLEKQPLGATIEITYRCNLRCSFCIADAETQTNEIQAQKELNWDEIEPVIEELGRFGPAPINITGGEALLRPDLVLRMARKARDVGLEPLLLTNATLVDDDLAHALHEAGINEVQVSIDSTYAEIHDCSRGVPGVYALTLCGIECLRKAGMNVSAACVITKRNIAHLREISQHFAAYGNHSKIAEVLPLGRGLHHPDLLSPEEILKLRVHLATNDSGQIETLLLPRERCSIGAVPAINPYGDVYPCFSMRFPPFLLGNVREHTLTEIWDNCIVLKELKAWRINDINGCNQCTNRLVCGGGCRAVAYAYHNTIYKPDPYHCKASHLFTEEMLQNGAPNTRSILVELLDISASAISGG